MSYMDMREVTRKQVQDINDHRNHHDDVHDLFYLRLHGDVGIDRPKQDTNDDEQNYQG